MQQAKKEGWEQKELNDVLNNPDYYLIVASKYKAKKKGGLTDKVREVVKKAKSETIVYIQTHPTEPLEIISPVIPYKDGNLPTTFGGGISLGVGAAVEFYQNYQHKKNMDRIKKDNEK